MNTIVSAFLEGVTVEKIVQQYPSLEMGDVYAVVSYYLRRRSEVEPYLRQRQQQVKTTDYPDFLLRNIL